MTQTKKTVGFAIVAVALALLAWLVTPSQYAPSVFNDEGELFYPEFRPADIQSVQVVTSKTDVFKVDKKKGVWSIPSHQNYPADTKEQIGKTAIVLNGLRKGAFRSDREKGFAGYGVLAPTDDAPEGRGKRVTLKDKSGRVLSDLVIGKTVEGQEKTYYCRKPDSNRVYSCKVDASGVSSSFKDWINTDLLTIKSWDIERVEIDNYHVDERTYEVVMGAVLVLTRDPSNHSKWVLKGLKKNEEVNEDTVRKLTDALGDLEILDVTRKPEGLLKALAKYRKSAKTKSGWDRAILQSVSKIMANKGYYLAPNRRGGLDVYSNEGELRVSGDDGVRYTLRFGEVVPGSAVATKDKKGDKDKKDADAKNAERRYLYITAEFDADLLDAKPRPPKEPVKPDLKKIEARVRKEQAAKKAKSAKKAPAEKAAAKKDAKDKKKTDKAKKPPKPKTVEEIAKAECDKAMAEYEQKKKDYEEDKKSYEKKLKDREEKVKKSEEKAKELQERFADWFYEISAESFAKLHVDRKELVKVKKEEKKGEKEEKKDKPKLPKPGMPK